MSPNFRRVTIVAFMLMALISAILDNWLFMWGNLIIATIYHATSQEGK